MSVDMVLDRYSITAVYNYTYGQDNVSSYSDTPNQRNIHCSEICIRFVVVGEVRNDLVRGHFDRAVQPSRNGVSVDTLRYVKAFYPPHL